MKIYVPGGGARSLPFFRAVPGVDEVITSQMSAEAPGNFLADRSYLLPRFDAPDFLDRFEALHAKERFDACVPVLDSALLLFARHAARLEALPCRFAMSPPATIELAADKLALNEFFRQQEIPTPATALLEDFASRPRFPAFLKPRHVSMRDFGEAIYRKLESEADLAGALSQTAGREAAFVVQDFLEGDEINVDFFCDAAGEVQSVVPLHRRSMTAKRTIAHGEIITDPGTGEACRLLVQRIASGTRLWGPAQLQLYRLPSGELRCTEINVRLCGSSPLVRAAGIDYFHHLVRLLRDEPTIITEKARPLSMTSGEALHFYETSPVRSLDQ